MNLAHPNATPSEPGEARGPEPSMEEILASIRRIIADDQSLPDHAVNLREPVLREAPAPEAPVEATRDEAPPAAVHVLRPDIAPETPRYAPGLVAVTPEIAAPQPVPPLQAASRLAPSELAPSQFVAPQSVAEEAHAGGPIAAPPFALPDGPRSAGPSRETARTTPTDDPPRGAAAASYREPGPRPAQDLDDVQAYQEDAETDMPPDGEPEPGIYDAPLGYTPRQSAPEQPSSLFSMATDQSVVSAFNVLAATRLADNSDELLAMTREMIRPILKEWLDDNLPSMVERLVRAEIERVSRGGR